MIATGTAPSAGSISSIDPDPGVRKDLYGGLTRNPPEWVG